MCATLINEIYPDATVLDVGCRDTALRKFLQPGIEYRGVDLVGGNDVLAHDLEDPLPLRDGEFDLAIALDVIEHVDNAQQLMKDLIRVANVAVIGSLPNMYYWKYRAKFLMGAPLGGKYEFTPEETKDRHRWLTSYKNSVSFIAGLAKDYETELKPIIYERRRNRLLYMLDDWGAKYFPNFFSYGLFFVITK
jgi:hypothetical protein